MQVVVVCSPGQFDGVPDRTMISTSREIAANLAITERRAHDIVNELAEGGCVVKMKDGRRNRYKIRVDLPCPTRPDSNGPSGRWWRCWPHRRIGAR